eukprot:UN04893
MEDGGSSLFDFVIKAHDYVRNGAISIREWQRVCKVIYKQMIECIHYIHSKNVCHCDISLENFLVNDVQVEVEQIGDTEKITVVTDNLQIKLCDFGLAKLFTKTKALSDRFVGKANYKSPEVVGEKKRFDAKKNDVWCVGVCLFMMIAGIKPWNIADKSDNAFMCIMNGKLMYLLCRWNILDRFDSNLIDLLQSIFRYEADRICLNKIKKHPWISPKMYIFSRRRYVT